MAYTGTRIALALSLTTTAMLQAAPASAQIYRYIDAEDASINDTTLELTDNSRKYVHIKKGDFVKPWLSPSQHYRGDHGIGFDLLPTSGTASDGNRTDKSNFRIIAGNEADALGFLQERFVGFALRLETNFETPLDNVQLFQWWQGSPFSPPLELRVRKNTMKWELVYRNDKTGRNPGASQVLAEGDMQTGRWYRFIVATTMSYDLSKGKGNVKLWLDGEQNPRLNRDGEYGYNPATSYYYDDGYYKADPKFDIFFGLYRPRQMKRAKAFFDQVRYGVTKGDVNPDQ